MREAGAMAAVLALSRSLSPSKCAPLSADNDAPHDTSPMLGFAPEDCVGSPLNKMVSTPIP